MVSDHQRLSVKNPQLQSTLFYEHSYLSETLTSRIQAITHDYKPPHLCKSDPVDCTTCDPWLQIGLSMEDCSAEGKRSQCWFVFSLSPCFLSMYLEMSSFSFRAHLQGSGRTFSYTDTNSSVSVSVTGSTFPVH